MTPPKRVPRVIPPEPPPLPPIRGTKADDRTLPPEVLNQLDALAKGVEDMVQTIQKLAKSKQKGNPNG